MLKRVFRFIFKNTVGKLFPIRYARMIGCKIGNDCIIETIDFGTEPYLIEIGNHVEVTTEVKFITHDGATWVIRNQEEYHKLLKFGKIILRDNCYIGRGAFLMPGIIVGENSIVGAGSVVTQNVPDNSVVAGNPAKYICSIREYAEKSISNMPIYDFDLYRKDKKREILRALSRKK